MRKGLWGGRHISVNVTGTGAEIEYDCAHGAIKQPIKLDEYGRFDIAGTFVPEGGPVSVTPQGVNQEKSFFARYRGQVKGDKMTLKVAVATAANLDGLILVYGQAPQLEKCY